MDRIIFLSELYGGISTNHDWVPTITGAMVVKASEYYFYIQFLFLSNMYGQRFQTRHCPIASQINVILHQLIWQLLVIYDAIFYMMPYKCNGNPMSLKFSSDQHCQWRFCSLSHNLVELVVRWHSLYPKHHRRRIVISRICEQCVNSAAPSRIYLYVYIRTNPCVCVCV